MSWKAELWYRMEGFLCPAVLPLSLGGFRRRIGALLGSARLFDLSGTGARRTRRRLRSWFFGRRGRRLFLPHDEERPALPVFGGHARPALLLSETGHVAAVRVHVLTELLPQRA